MITIDWIDDHNPKSISQQAIRQAPGASFSGLGEMRQLFGIAQNHHQNLLAMLSLNKKKNQKVDEDQIIKLSKLEEDSHPAMPRTRSVENL